MKRILLAFTMLLCCLLMTTAQERRPIDNKHPMWLIHVDVWNKADPQKIINLIPTEVRPYVVMNLSLSCGYDIARGVHRMPQNAILTYRSWATVCQQNGMWFTCQPASGGHTHIMDNDLETFEYFFQKYPNFLGWNFAEQFWGFSEVNDKFSSSVHDRLLLFAKLIEMSHKYGGLLTVSFCGNIWSHPLNPVGMMRCCPELLEASKKYPENMLWLYKYTTSTCFYNNESVSFGPFVAGLAKNYGVRYDNCGWNGATSDLIGEGKCKYPTSAGIGTVMEQTCQNGGAVWDGPELIWTEDFQNLSDSKNSAGYTVRNWGRFPGFDNGWIDMFKRIIEGTMYIPSREEVVENTKVIIINDSKNSSHEEMFAAWNTLYDGLYKQTDPFNRNSGYWMDNYCYFKKTGRYRTIPITPMLNDELAKTIPLQVKKSQRNTVWPTNTAKVNAFNNLYPQISDGDLFVSRFKNQLVTYTPYTYLNAKTSATATIPLLYNTCESLTLTWDKLSSGLVREYGDSLCFYLNNYRSDTVLVRKDIIVVNGAKEKPTYTVRKHGAINASCTATWDEATGKYSLAVSHLGPVDICIKAVGNATDRSTDVIVPTPLEKPKQPEAYNGLVIHEAEDMDYINIKSCVTDPFNWYPNVYNHAGNGFVDMGTNKAGALKGTFKVKTRTYNIYGIRYTNPGNATTVQLQVGTTIVDLPIEKTAQNEWRNASSRFFSSSVNSTVTVKNNNGAPIYIDQVFCRPDGSEEESWNVTVREAEHGTAYASVETAPEGEKVTLEATPEKGYTFVGWEIIHGKVNIAEDGSFTMPNDNVTLVPVFQDENVVYQLDMTKTLSGNIPAGWQSAQGSNDIHEYPNTYTSGSRTMTGFPGDYRNALYWRTLYACYGNQKDYPLYLEPGDYTMTANVAAWKSAPAYKLAVKQVGSAKFLKTSASATCTPNANGDINTSDISTAKELSMDFTVSAAGNYEVRVNVGGGTGDEFLLCAFAVKKKIDPVAVTKTFVDEDSMGSVKIYDASGKILPVMQRGLNIIEFSDGTVKKLWIK
ncbi:MAG: glycosyl hydrolase family 98 [Prevotella sp.]|nr:glycosyl hydrolase family 98 [Candidatus Prevotella equi]